MDEEFYLKLCRLCLSKPEGQINCLIDHKIQQTFNEAVSDIELEVTSSFSSIICQTCMSLLTKIKAFKDSIRKNQTFLLGLLEKTDIDNPTLGNFLEVNVDAAEEFTIKIEEEREKSNDEEKIPPKTKRAPPRSRMNPKGSSEEDSLTDDTLEYEDPDMDDFSDKDSLSSTDFARPEPESENTNKKLPLPALNYEKDGTTVWCPFCYIKFKSKYYMAGHGKICHPEYNWAFRKPKSTRTRWVCKFCDKTFTRRFRLKEHAKVIHFGREPYSCDLCGTTCQHKSGIRCHIYQKHMKKRKIVQTESVICEICNHVSKTKEIYKKHMTLHEPAEDRSFVCAKCNLFFRKQKSLDKHNRNNHIMEQLPFGCDLCISARFLTEDVLKLHQKRHECDEKRRLKQPFPCSACELRFCKKAMLVNHTRHHEKNEMDSCQTCGLTLHQGSMNDHMDTHRTKYEDFKNVCHLCGRRFRVEWSLIKHVRTHDAPEHFECDKCGKIIKKKCNFANHVKKCEGPITEFPCRFCGLKLPNKSKRYKHEDREHKGFSCKRCNMRFDRYQGLKVHRRTLEHKQKGKNWGKLLAAGLVHDTGKPLDELY